MIDEWWIKVGKPHLPLEISFFVVFSFRSSPCSFSGSSCSVIGSSCSNYSLPVAIQRGVEIWFLSHWDDGEWWDHGFGWRIWSGWVEKWMESWGCWPCSSGILHCPQTYKMTKIINIHVVDPCPKILLCFFLLFSFWETHKLPQERFSACMLSLSASREVFT